MKLFDLDGLGIVDPLESHGLEILIQLMSVLQFVIDVSGHLICVMLYNKGCLKNQICICL